MSAAQRRAIPAPAEFLGHEVGADRQLADWPQICEYFWMLDRASERVQVREIGKSTEGNPFLMAVIASPETLANLEHYRRIQQRLADPRTIRDDAEAEELISQGKAVIMITCGVHASEVGATQMSMLVGHYLATSDDETVRRILDNVIFLFVPSLNPDGLFIVKKWYESTLGTWYEGVNQPVLYNTYVGHDNNRDWFMFTQAETKLLVEHGHNAWHPHVVYDMHQTRANGPRLFVPPFTDPIDPNVDPALQGEIAMLGTAMFSELVGQGKAGVVIHCMYDAYSPSRAYQHYHGAIRILSEAASCRIATPIDLKREDLTGGRDIDPRVQAWNNPMPWQGGRWGLRDIVDYGYAAVMAALSNVARYRDTWVRNFYSIGKRAVSGPKKPFAYLVPQAQRNPITANEMLQVMHTAQVEVHEATREFTAAGVRYPAGTRIIFTAQPYGAFAKTMMEVQHYPDLRLYPGGPPKPPYDVTAHSLPLQMGVHAVEVQQPFEAPVRAVDQSKPAPGRVVRHGQGRGLGYLLGAETNASALAVNRLLVAGAQVSRIADALTVDDRRYEAGSYVIEGVQGVGQLVDSLAADHGLNFDAVSSVPSGSSWRLGAPRVGLYRSWMPTAEEGWARWIFERYEFPYVTLVDADIRQGHLGERFDVVVLPHQPAQGAHAGNSPNDYPEEYAGGLGDLGAASLRAFVEAGGTLIAWDGTAEYAIRYLDLPVTNILQGLPNTDFYAPGSFFRVLLDTDHPVAYGMPQRTSVMFQHSPVFDVRQGTMVGKYPMNDLLLSGWVMGQQRLYGRTALAEVPVGRGRVILIGFKVHFRAQARGTYRILFNSMYYGAATRSE